MKEKDTNQVLNLVEEFEESSVRFLQDMIKAKSENPPGEYKEIASVVKQEMENLGIETKIVEFSPLGDFETLLSMEEITSEVRGWIEKDDLPPELQPNMNEIPNVVGRIN